MKFLMILSLVFCMSAYAGDEGTAAGQQSQTEGSPEQQQNVSEFNKADFQKFYIGFSESQGEKKLVTVDIKSLDSLDGEIRFDYTMNSIDDREDGEGKILLSQNIVEFGTKETGTVYRGEDGKIVFESSAQDSLNHWIMKEK